MRLLVLLNLASTLYMTGLIWFVQVVHYPLFRGVGETEFTAYAQSHVRLTGWVVGPMMLVEAATTVALLVYRPAAIGFGSAAAGAVILAIIWASTAFWQVPRHQRLGGGFDPSAHTSLVVTNWLRTIGWSARAVLVLWFAARLMP